MFEKELLNFHVGQCGACGLRIRFWPVDGSKLTCPACGLEHEVERGEALDLSTGEKTEAVMLVVAVENANDAGRVDVSQN